MAIGFLRLSTLRAQRPFLPSILLRFVEHAIWPQADVSRNQFHAYAIALFLFRDLPRASEVSTSFRIVDSSGLPIPLLFGGLAYSFVFNNFLADFDFLIPTVRVGDFASLTC